MICPLNSSDDDQEIRKRFLIQDEDSLDFEDEMNMERDGKVQLNGDDNKETKAKCDQETNPNDDDLLYDPGADNEDEKWAANKRRLISGIRNDAGLSSSIAGSSRTDGTLNCPCCMTMLCLDSQRHEIYKTQYRAMFVFNCSIDFNQSFEYKDKKKLKKRFHGKTDRSYYPVKCTVCNTQVAVYDSDEVYHFFNVLASY